MWLTKTKVSRKWKRDEVVPTRKITAHFLRAFSKILRRVCNSTLAAETISLLTGTDAAIGLKHLFISLGFKVRLHVLCDCASLVEHVARQSIGAAVAQSKRLAIDVEIIKQGLDDGEIDGLYHVPHRHNYSDCQTKWLESSVENLEDGISNGEIEVPVYTDSPLDEDSEDEQEE